ncbi:MAG: hypothetical protein QXF79_04810, partial [Ignisphaera sp.]
MLNGLKKLKTSKDFILILIFTIFISSISILINMPSTTPYSPYNEGREGYTQIAKFGVTKFAKDLRNLEQKNLIIIPLNSRPDVSLIKLIENLLERGAIVIFLDEEGYSNDIMEYFGIKIVVENTKILDEVSKTRSREYPLVNLEIEGTLFKLAAYKPSHIIVDEKNCNTII